MVRARLFSIDSAFEKTSFFRFDFVFGFWFDFGFLPKKSSVANRKLEKKKVYAEGGDTHLREKDI
jgi:hypothetical protein